MKIFLNNTVLGRDIYVLSQCPPNFFKAALSVTAGSTRYMTTMYPTGVDMGPVCVAIIGISGDNLLKGNHPVKFGSNSQDQLRKSIIVFPIRDDFTRSTACISHVFDEPELTYNVWKNGIQCTTRSAPCELIFFIIIGIILY